MSLTAALNFYLPFIGDGADTSLTVSLITAPFSFLPPGSAESAAQFSLASLTPSSADNLSVSTGGTISASINTVLKTMTFTFGTAPGNGVYGYIGGTFLF